MFKMFYIIFRPDKEIHKVHRVINISAYVKD